MPPPPTPPTGATATAPATAVSAFSSFAVAAQPSASQGWRSPPLPPPPRSPRLPPRQSRRRVRRCCRSICRSNALCHSLMGWTSLRCSPHARTNARAHERNSSILCQCVGDRLNKIKHKGWATTIAASMTTKGPLKPTFRKYLKA